MSRNFNNRVFLCWLLCFLLIFQPVFVEIALAEAAPESTGNSEISTVDNSDRQTQSANTDMNTVDTSSWTIKTGNWFKDLLISGAKAIIRKVRKAEKEVKKAKTDYESSRNEVNSTAKDSTQSNKNTRGAVDTSEGARKKDNLSQASGARGKAQATLEKVGKKLEGLATIIERISQGLMVISGVLGAMTGFPFVGGICGTISSILKTVSSVLKKVAAVMKVAAKAVLTAASAAKLSDVDFKQFAKEAAEAWKNSGNEPVVEKKAIPEGNAKSPQPATAKPEIVIEENNTDEGFRESASDSDEVDTVDEPDLPPGMGGDDDDEDSESRSGSSENSMNESNGQSEKFWDKVENFFERSKKYNRDNESDNPYAIEDDIVKEKQSEPKGEESPNKKQ